MLLLLAAACQSDVPPRCPSFCSGHGRCTATGHCLCDRGFTGDACDRVEAACPGNCAGHGRCDGEQCICDPGFGGRDCGRAIRRVCPSSCSGRGTCHTDGTCTCNPGFSGRACDVLVRSVGCAHNCSGRGFCAGGSCVCVAGLSGAACERVHAPVDASGCPHNCSGRGECVPLTAGLLAAPARHPVSPLHERAVASSLVRRPLSLQAGPMPSICRCDAGWHGAACDRFEPRSQELACPRGCSGHGSCIRGGCVCDTGYGGRDCGSLVATAQCVDGCSGRGECRVAPVEGVGPTPGTRNAHWQPWRALGDDGRWRAAPGRTPNKCLCHDGSAGPTCALGISVSPGCPNACSGRGFCRDGGCHCEAGYGGDDCGVVCPGGCSGHGTCSDAGTCECEPGRWGKQCEIASSCKAACSLRGRCAPSDSEEQDREAAEAAKAAARRAREAAKAAVTSIEAAEGLARAAEHEAARLARIAGDAQRPRCHCMRGWGTWGANATYSYDHDCSQPDRSDQGCPVGCNEERGGGTRVAEGGLAYRQGLGRVNRARARAWAHSS